MKFSAKTTWDTETSTVEADDARAAALKFTKKFWQTPCKRTGKKPTNRYDLRVELTGDGGLVWRYKVPAQRAEYNTERIYSPPLALFRLVREGRSEQWALSRIQQDHADQHTLTLAIVSAMQFDPGDVAEISSAFGHHADEGDYAAACGSTRGGGDRGVANRSFCQAFERWKGRKPFIVRDPENKTGSRMYIGRRFSWRVNETIVTLECTSFHADGESFIGTQTDTTRGGLVTSAKTKVLRRIRITHAMVKEWHRTLDERQAARNTQPQTQEISS